MKKHPIRVRAVGFTLLELLVSLSIAVILLGAGIGFSSGRFNAEKEMTRVAARVELAVRQASMTAAIEQKDVVLTLFQESVVNSAKRIDLGNGKLWYVHRGRSNRWSKPSREGYAWKFNSSGLTEPVLLKVTFPGGHCVLDFDPLTGQTRERLVTVY